MPFDQRSHLIDQRRQLSLVLKNFIGTQVMQFMREHQPFFGFMNIVVWWAVGLVVIGFVIGGSIRLESKDVGQDAVQDYGYLFCESIKKPDCFWQPGSLL
jgi:hypothetical protein